MVFYQITYFLLFIINYSFHQSIIAVMQDCFAGISNLLSLGFCSLHLSLAFLCFTDENNSFREAYYLSPFTRFIFLSRWRLLSCISDKPTVPLAWRAKLGDDPLLKSYYLEKARWILIFFVSSNWQDCASLKNSLKLTTLYTTKACQHFWNKKWSLQLSVVVYDGVIYYPSFLM